MLGRLNLSKTAEETPLPEDVRNAKACFRRTRIFLIPHAVVKNNTITWWFAGGTAAPNWLAPPLPCAPTGTPGCREISPSGTAASNATAAGAHPAVQRPEN